MKRLPLIVAAFALVVGAGIFFLLHNDDASQASNGSSVDGPARMAAVDAATSGDATKNVSGTPIAATPFRETPDAEETPGLTLLVVDDHDLPVPEAKVET